MRQLRAREDPESGFMDISGMGGGAAVSSLKINRDRVSPPRIEARPKLICLSGRCTMMTPITLTAACGAEKEEEENVGDNALSTSGVSNPSPGWKLGNRAEMGQLDQNHARA